MDTPATESTTPLDTNQAASLFATMLDDQPKQQEAETPPEQPAEESPAEPVEATAETEAEQPAEDGQKVTIEVDGKTVELTPAEIAEAYKNGLRQADYTRKTMEAAELRKTATAETEAARAERQRYAVNLQTMEAQLRGALEQQQQTDWDALARENPAAWVEQRNLYERRQAAYQQTLQQQQVLAQQYAIEQQQAAERHLSEQRDQLLAKLPEWKDAAKAKAEKVALREYLQTQGFDADALESVADHRAVILGRKAMLYDQMMAKAQAAQKRVSALPTKVERPGVAETQGLDRRQTAFQRLGKTGKVEDAAAVFASLL